MAMGAWLECSAFGGELAGSSCRLQSSFQLSALSPQLPDFAVAGRLRIVEQIIDLHSFVQSHPFRGEAA
jgi:hypothetical protein